MEYLTRCLGQGQGEYGDPGPQHLFCVYVNRILRIEYPEAFSFIYEHDDHYSLMKEFLPSVMFVECLPYSNCFISLFKMVYFRFCANTIRW